MVRTLAMGMLLFAYWPLSAQTVDELLDRATKLQDAYEEVEALQVYEQVLERDPRNLKALTQASYLSASMGNRKDEGQRDEMFKQAKEYASRALRIDSNHAEANFVMGVAMGRIALISPTKEKLEASKDVKKYSERTLRLDRQHAGGWHLLGRWHYGVKELGATKMFLIKTIYGGMPKASYETAVACFNKAINLRPDYILYYLDLAKTYLAMGQDGDAKSVLEKALQKDPVTPDDPDYLEECRKLLEDL